MSSSPSSRTGRASFSSLPGELQAAILGFAINERRGWEDLDTLKSLVLVDKACSSVAAPIYWRAVNLSRKSAAKLDTVLTLRESTREMVRQVRTHRMQTWSYKTPVEMYAKIAKVVQSFPNVEGLEVCLVDSYEEGAPGWAFYDSLAAIHLKLERVKIYVFASDWQEDGDDLSLPDALPLELLDANKLERLSLDLSSLRQSDVDRCIQAISRFAHLQHLALRIRGATVPLPLITPVPSDLRSFHLEAFFEPIEASELSLFLQSVSPKLERLSLRCHLEGSLPTSFDFPNLRHLRCDAGNPITLLHSFVSSPLKVLELVPPLSLFGGGDRSEYSLVECIQRLQKLELYITNEDILDSMDPSEIMPLIMLIKERGIVYFDKTGNDEKELGELMWRDVMAEYENWVDE
ncbi:hypothetical protein JCM6882_004526 [Rhodosporidiobolus microsporus]